MRVVLAIDSFKGCLTSAEANRAAADGVLRACPEAEVVSLTVSDGGEGFLDAFAGALGGQMIETTVCDPLLRPVRAHYLLKETMAVVEMAQASGLTLLAPDERKVLQASTYGTGQLVADAIERGARKIVVGLGGSATSEAGMGMLRALIDRFARHGTWADVRFPQEVAFTIATDVDNPLCGTTGAAHVFAPQKGATPDMVERLDERARRFAQASARHFGYDRSACAGAGAAGGLGYAFMQYLDARRASGIDLLLDALRYDEVVAKADLVVTGEGAADRQTLMGKLPMGLLRRSHGVPVWLVAGRVTDEEELVRAGFARTLAVSPSHLPLDVAMQPAVARRNLSHALCQLLRACAPA